MAFYIKKCMTSTDEIGKKDISFLFCLLKRYLESSSEDFEVGRTVAVLKKEPSSAKLLLQYQLQITTKDLYSSVSNGNDMYSFIDDLNITFLLNEASSQRNDTRRLFITSDQMEGDSCFGKASEDVWTKHFWLLSRPHPCESDKAYSPSNVPRERCKRIGINVMSSHDDVNITWDCQPIGESDTKLSSKGYSILKTFAYLIQVQIFLCNMYRMLII